MVLQKVGAAGCDLCGHPTKMRLDALDVAANNAVVQRFVIGEIKSQRLQTTFEVPIDLGQEKEISVSSLHQRDCVSPEIANRCLRLVPPGDRKVAPCPLKDVVQHKHRHITADAIAS